MHDGIHKNVPVPNDWKSLIQVCSQGVWKEHAPQKAEKIILNCCKELRPIVEQAQALLSNPQACLNSSMGIEQLRRSCDITLQKNFVDSFERNLAHNEVHPIDQACVSAIQESLDAHLRNIDGYLALHFPQLRSEMNDKLHQALKSTTIEKPIRDLVAGVELQPTRLSPVTADEVL